MSGNTNIVFFDEYKKLDNEFTYHMIKALEEKNDGKFDYE